MAKNVSIEFPAFPVNHVDCVFKVKDGNAVFGDLKVSKGGIEWRPKFKRHEGGRTVELSWAKFAKAMQKIAESD